MPVDPKKPVALNAAGMFVSELENSALFDGYSQIKQAPVLEPAPVSIVCWIY
jgi:hypothetical protein